MYKLKLTPVSRKIFFAQYLGLPVFAHMSVDGTNILSVVSVTGYQIDHISENSRLLLKPILILAPEEAIRIAQIAGYNSNDFKSKDMIEIGIKIANGFIDGDNPLNIHEGSAIADYLRQQGYAISYGNIPVVELIKEGLITYGPNVLDQLQTTVDLLIQSLIDRISEEEDEELKY